MTKSEWSSILYFKPHEFDSPDSPGSGENMDYELVSVLDSLRAYVNEPLKIASGIRTQKYNNSIGGAKDSAHVDGMAADITCFTSSLRYKIIRFAILNNVKRIEVCDRHVHIDVSKTLPQGVVIWGKSK